MLSHFLKNRLITGTAIGLLITIFTGLLMAFGAFNSLHRIFSDALYTREGETSKDIVIIAIDDKSTSESPVGLGRFSQWSRENYVQMLDVLKKENPKVIAFDIIFHTYTTMFSSDILINLDYETATLTNKEKLDKYQEFINQYKLSFDNPIDEKFAQKLQEFDNIILPGSIGIDGIANFPLSEFSKKAVTALVNAPLDSDGTIRQTIPSFEITFEGIDYKQRTHTKSFDNYAVATVKKYLGKTSEENLDLPLENGKLLVNFFGPPFSYQMIPFVDVVNGKFQAGTFTDKIVLVGPTSFKEVHDEHYTPLSSKTPMPGVEFRANEIQTILEGKFLNNQGTLSQIFVLLILAIGLTVAFNYLNILFSILGAFAAIIFYIISAHLFYRQGIIVNMIYPFIAILLAYLGSWIYKYFIADKSKREIKSAFSHYVSGDLVEQIAKNPEKAALGGEKRTVTVFFSDLKNSTGLSEQTQISSWVSQLNEYFTAMENVIKHFGGTIDKYEGDAIMGFWNAPVLQPNHISLAYQAALEMRKILKFLNAKWAKESRPVLEFRIGINTGEVIVGNIGSKERFNYTVMGDTVNTASRLESGANKTYGTSTIICGFSGLLSEEQKSQFVIRELDTVYLPGKNEPVTLFELVCLKGEMDGTIVDGENGAGAKGVLASVLQNYASGLAAYRAKDFAKATPFFEAALGNSSQNSPQNIPQNSVQSLSQNIPQNSVQDLPQNFPQSLPPDSPSKILLSRCQALSQGQKLPELDEKMVWKIGSK